MKKLDYQILNKYSLLSLRLNRISFVLCDKHFQPIAIRDRDIVLLENRGGVCEVHLHAFYFGSSLNPKN